MGIFLGLLHKRNVGGLWWSVRDFLALTVGKAKASWCPCMIWVHQLSNLKVRVLLLATRASAALMTQL